MSNIPRARELINEVLDYQLPNRVRDMLCEALNMMTREPPVTRARAVHPVINTRVKLSARRLADEGLTHHQIAQRLNLRNGGRVSEILNGKR